MYKAPMKIVRFKATDVRCLIILYMRLIMGFRYATIDQVFCSSEVRLGKTVPCGHPVSCCVLVIF